MPASSSKALVSLRERLLSSGFLQFHRFFGEGNLRIEDWANASANLSGDLKEWVRLFLLKMPLTEAKAKKLLGAPLLDLLLDAEVLARRDQRIVSNDFVLITYRSLFLFCQIAEDPWAYFGEDSLALAAYQTPQPGGRALDLCSGPGIQALVSGLLAEEALGVEVHPKAAKLAAINAALNGLEKRVAFRRASYDDYASEVRDGHWDLITFNPPLVPVPDNLDYAFVGHGGTLGTRHSEAIIRQYARALAPGGRMEFVGVGAGKADRSVFPERLGKAAREHRLDLRVQLLSRHPLRKDAPFFDSYAETIARRNRLDTGAAAQDLQRHYAKRGLDHFYLFFCSLCRFKERRRPKQDVLDSSFFYYGDWFA